MSVFLELIRRVQREYDYFLKDKHGIPTRSYFTYTLKKDKSNDGDCSSPVRTSSATLQITFWEHAVRSVFYILQFVNAYFIMLLAMVCFEICRADDVVLQWIYYHCHLSWCVCWTSRIREGQSSHWNETRNRDKLLLIRLELIVFC